MNRLINCTSLLYHNRIIHPVLWFAAGADGLTCAKGTAVQTLGSALYCPS